MVGTETCNRTKTLNIQVVQECERVIIFRLGRLLKSGARPGILIINPLIEVYR